MSTRCLCIVFFSVAVAHSAFDKARDAADADWLKISAWIRSNGGHVESTVRGNMTSHSGFSIRGIVSEKTGQPAQPVLAVPKKLWLTLDNFPDICEFPLESLPKCGHPLQKSHLILIKTAGAIALETKKGNASFYHVYLGGLPRLDEFRSFHPRFMGADVQEDFTGLPITGIAQELQLFDVQLRECFQSWTKVPNSIVAGITLDEIQLAMIQYRTRTFDIVGKFPSMIPGADFFNTEKPILVNTVWQVTNSSFQVNAIAGKVKAGSELYYMYCKKCDNTKYMAIWGLYLEGNENPMQTPAANCAAHVDESQPLRHGKFRSLREASEAMLDLNSASAPTEMGSIAPRCRQAALSSSQGPLRCSFARLAWEHCALEWGYLSAKAPVNALIAEAQRSLPATADLIRQSFTSNSLLKFKRHQSLNHSL